MNLNKGKIFCIGDPHGAYKALLQVLKRSSFNKEEDILICLGDVSDGWTETPECFEELLSIKNLIYIIGNHDFWLLEYLKYDKTPHIWLSQGGANTWKSYEKLKNMMDFDQIERHIKLLEEAKLYHIQDNKIFIHGGFNWKVPIDEQYREYVIWDRTMIKTALMWSKEDKLKFPIYDEIYVGHTTTEAVPYLNARFKSGTKPLFLTNLIALDTGAGWSGKLTIMNIETKEFWQSDLVKTLYPNEKGR